MITHSSLGISGSICSECRFELDPWDFSPLRFVVACVVHQDFHALTQISNTTLCTDSVSSRSICSRCVASSGVAGWFAAFLSGWPRAFSCSSLSQGALSLMFLCRLAQSSFQLVVADHWPHVLFTRALACLRVQEESAVEVDNVETFSFVENFRNSCTVSDNLSTAVRLGHRSSVCTLLHRQDGPR